MGGKRVYDATLEILYSTIDIISRSKYSKYCVLMGGTAFLSRLLNACGILSRNTYDIDLDIESREVLWSFVEDIEPILNRNTLGYVYKIKSINRRTNETCNIALDVYSNNIRLCTVYFDLSVADFRTIKFSYLPAVNMNAFDVQTMASDKLCVFYSDVIFRRIKDLYDLTVLANMASYSSSELIQMMKVRHKDFYDKAKISINANTFQRLAKGYEAYTNATGTNTLFELPVMINTCMSFGEPILKALDGYVWDNEKMLWL